MPETALKEMINCIEEENFVGAAVAIEDHYENPFIVSVLESKAPDMLEQVMEIVEELQSNPHHNLDGSEEYQVAYATFIDQFRDTSLANFECAYQGHFHSDEKFVEYLIDDCGYMEVPDHILPYFDYGTFARDIMHDHCEYDGHYFSNHW